MKPIRHHLQRDLLALLFLVIVAMVGVASLGAYRAGRMVTESRLQENLLHLTRDVEEILEQVEEVGGEVERLWRVDRLSTRREPELEAYFQELLHAKKDIHGIAFLDEEGRGIHLRKSSTGTPVRVSVLASTQGSPTAAGGWYRIAERQRKPAWTDIEWFGQTLHPGLALLLPIFREGYLQGVIRVEIQVTQLAGRAWANTPLDGSQILLVDHRNRVLIRPRPDHLDLGGGWDDFGRPLAPETLPLFHKGFQKFDQGQSIARIQHGGQTYLVGKDTLNEPPGTRWTFAVACPETAFWTGSLMGHLALLVGFGLTLAGLVGWRIVHLTQRMMQPVEALHRAAQSLENGRTPLPVRSDVLEFQTLGQAMVHAGQALERERGLQAQLETAERLRIMGTLAGGIAHDINNQLAAMVGQLNLAKGYLTETSPAWDRIERAEEATGRCSQMIRSLLGFGRRTPTVMGPVPLNELARHGANLIEQGSAPVELRLRLDPRAPRAAGNRAALEQVLTHLVRNAIDAMPQGGQITLITDRISNDQVMVAVSDTGVGMPTQVASHIFEPFYTTKEIGKGSGLGLALAHGIIQSHEGRIEFDTHPGRGSSFRVYLPAWDPEGDEDLPTATTLAVPSGLLKGRRILVVEDEPTLRDLIQDALSREEAMVTTAVDGMRGWAIFQEGDFDLVLTDHRMPKLTGLELLAKIRIHFPHLPVVLTSGYGLEGREAELREDPHLRLLPKPFAFNLLVRTLKDMIQPRSW